MSQFVGILCTCKVHVNDITVNGRTDCKNFEADCLRHLADKSFLARKQNEKK